MTEKDMNERKTEEEGKTRGPTRGIQPTEICPDPAIKTSDSTKMEESPCQTDNPTNTKEGHIA